jgi:hypothetical protein
MCRLENKQTYTYLHENAYLKPLPELQAVAKNKCPLFKWDSFLFRDFL